MLITTISQNKSEKLYLKFIFKYEIDKNINYLKINIEQTTHFFFFFEKLIYIQHFCILIHFQKKLLFQIYLLGKSF